MKQRPSFIFQLLVLAGILAGGNIAAAGEWETLENCRIINAGGNYGDTFNVQQDGKSYWFRLYFVEAPQADEANPGEIKKDAEYFHLNEKEALELGKMSQGFALKFLAGRNFTLRTCWEEAGTENSNTYYYALVEKDSRSLIEALTETGLVRLGGAPTPGKDSPLHVAPVQYRAKLKRLEDDAKTSRAGGWSHLPEPAASKPSVAPAQVPAPAVVPAAEKPPVVPAVIPSVPIPASIQTVNINTATQAEIEGIPGIGPVLAKRMIERRPFAGPEDLQKVQGIGQKTADKIMPYVRYKD